jgi:arylformamidase
MIDISWPLKQGTTEYKDRKTVVIELVARFESDDREESRLCMGTHTGTHIDAPAHFIKGGKALDQFLLHTFYGPCVVVDLSECEELITEQALKEHRIDEGVIVLLKTRNSQLSAEGPFCPEFVYLSEDGAQYLVQQGVTLVGIDYLSIERNQPDHTTHKALLSKDIPILEGLRLAHVTQGRYVLSCFPLNLVGAEAAPCRAVLIPMNQN